MEMSAAAFEIAATIYPDRAAKNAAQALRDYAAEVRELRTDLDEALTEIDQRQGDLAFVPHWKTGKHVDG